jgi:hypothetical protein
MWNHVKLVAVQKTIVVPGPDGKPTKKVVTETQRLDQTKKYLRQEDFCLIVKPYNDDGQSVSMQYSNDRSTELSVDDNKTANVALYVLTKGGKAYYYYTLNGSRYPKGQGKITPHDGKSIYFMVGSSERYDASKDNVAVNLTVNNRSNVPIDLKIKNDDKNNPRIRIIKKVGQINILN